MFNIHLLFGIFGNITALILFLVPSITFWKIIKNKSTEQFSGFPYVATFLNCLLNTWYGMPFVSPNNLPMSTVNGTGAILELCYVILFICYIRDKKDRVKIIGLLLVVLTFFGMVILVSLLALHGKIRKLFCGFIFAIFCIFMYGSPLLVMRLVIKTKSVKYMPFFLSLSFFLCGTSWFIFGLLGNDPFVYVPNGSGSALGALQLILYFTYKDWKKKNNNSDKSSPPPEKEGKVQGVDQMSDVEKGSYGQAKADSAPHGPASQVKLLNGNHLLLK